MIKLTYSELKQALLCCTAFRDCTHCPLNNITEPDPEVRCTYHLMSAAWNCINAMEKDLIDIKTLTEHWDDAVAAYEVDVIKLREKL
jgi:hypothetical protein